MGPPPKQQQQKQQQHVKLPTLSVILFSAIALLSLVTFTMAKMSPEEFENLDFNSDRAISIDELRQWFGQRFSPAVLGELIRDILEMDRNSDGVITFEEFHSGGNPGNINQPSTSLQPNQPMQPTQPMQPVSTQPTYQPQPVYQPNNIGGGPMRTPFSGQPPLNNNNNLINDESDHFSAQPTISSQPIIDHMIPTDSTYHTQGLRTPNAPHPHPSNKPMIDKLTVSRPFDVIFRPKPTKPPSEIRPKPRVIQHSPPLQPRPAVEITLTKEDNKVHTLQFSSSRTGGAGGARGLGLGGRDNFSPCRPGRSAADRSNLSRCGGLGASHSRSVDRFNTFDRPTDESDMRAGVVSFRGHSFTSPFANNRQNNAR